MTQPPQLQPPRRHLLPRRPTRRPTRHSQLRLPPPRRQRRNRFSRPRCTSHSPRGLQRCLGGAPRAGPWRTSSSSSRTSSRGGAGRRRGLTPLGVCTRFLRERSLPRQRRRRLRAFQSRPPARPGTTPPLPCPRPTTPLLHATPPSRRATGWPGALLTGAWASVRPRGARSPARRLNHHASTALPSAPRPATQPRRVLRRADERAAPDAAGERAARRGLPAGAPPPPLSRVALPASTPDASRRVTRQPPPLWERAALATGPMRQSRTGGARR